MKTRLMSLDVVAYGIVLLVILVAAGISTLIN